MGLYSDYVLDRLPIDDSGSGLGTRSSAAPPPNDRDERLNQPNGDFERDMDLVDARAGSISIKCVSGSYMQDWGLLNKQVFYGRWGVSLN